MNITQEKLDDQNAVLKVVVEPADYASKLDSRYKSLSKTMNIPGFRPGKVPVGLIKSKYGKGLLVEEVENLVSSELNLYISEQKLPLVGGVIPKREGPVAGDWDKPDVFEFHFEVGLKPELDVELTKSDKLKYHTIEIDDEQVNQEVDAIRRRYGKVQSADTVGGDDMVSGDFVELDEKDEILPGGIMSTGSVFLRSVKPDAQKALEGKKAGEEVIVNPKDLVENPEDLAKMLNIDEEAAEGLNTNFKFTVGGISRLEPAEMDEELFDTVFGDDVVKSEEEFKAKVKESLQSRYSRDSDALFRRDLSHYLIEKYNPTLPDDFLKRWMVNDGGFEGDIESEYPGYRRATQWQLIVDHLIETKKIEVNAEAIKDKTKEILKERYAQYGLPEPGEDQLEETARRVLEKREEVEEVTNLVVNDQLVTYARENAKVEEKQVKFDKFVELASTDPAEQAVKA